MLCDELEFNYECINPKFDAVAHTSLLCVQGRNQNNFGTLVGVVNTCFHF